MGKTEEMERKALAQVLGLVETSGSLKVEEVLKHSVTFECLSYLMSMEHSARLKKASFS